MRKDCGNIAETLRTQRRPVGSNFEMVQPYYCAKRSARIIHTPLPTVQKITMLSNYFLHRFEAVVAGPKRFSCTQHFLRGSVGRTLVQRPPDMPDLLLRPCCTRNTSGPAADATLACTLGLPCKQPVLSLLTRPSI